MREFERLELRPVGRPVDVNRVRDHLAGLPHALVDPLDADGWVLAGNARLAAVVRELSAEERLAGIRVWVTPEMVAFDARATLEELARARAFARWLVADGGRWDAVLDGRRTERVEARVDELFPEDLADPLPDDPLALPVVAGTLTALYFQRADADPLEIRVHSSGACAVGGSRTTLDDPTRDAWNAAVERLDFDDPDLDGYDWPPGGAAGGWRETPARRDELTWFDRAHPPESWRTCVQIAESLVTRGTLGR